MAEYIPLSEEEKEKNFKEHFERAKKGVLQFVVDNGDKHQMSEMHDYSLNKFFIQHQAFSKLMETLVDEELITFNHIEKEATITDKGKDYISN